MKKLTVLDAYCGAGGFSEGFRQQGFEIIAGIDNWKPAVDTFNYNFGLAFSPRDISEFETSTKMIEALPDTDVIIGSPPCVSFSSSNKSGKADKAAGLRLTRIFLRIVAVKKHKPKSKLKAWLMENVTNSRIHLPQQYTFEQLKLRRWALEQDLDPKAVAISLAHYQTVVNSADYGVPQSRLRVITGEIVRSKERLLTRMTHLPPNQNGQLPRHITLRYVRRNLPKPNARRSSRYVVDPLYPNIKIKQSELTDQFYDTGLYACDWKGSKFLKTNHPYMGPMSFPENEDRPSRTITATKIGNSREAIIFQSEHARKRDGRYRIPTIREAATLMGFPITFQFVGSEGNKWKLVGNAVCPPVSRAFAKVVRAECGYPPMVRPRVMSRLPPLDDVPNLNMFKPKTFNNPPRKRRGSRFRRHPFKLGNLTVTLSNYDIEGDGRCDGNWRSSIQYGTGQGFPTQSFPDGYFKTLEPIIMQFEGGPGFIETMSNGFSERVAASGVLQEMYEQQRRVGDYMEPAELVDAVGQLIERIPMREPHFQQPAAAIFKKHRMPKAQVMALYALNRICSIANGDANE